MYFLHINTIISRNIGTTIEYSPTKVLNKVSSRQGALKVPIVFLISTQKPFSPSVIVLN